LVTFAATTPINLSELATEAKSILCVAMVFGRLETLAIIALVFEAMDQE
jgi:trk system potassium uptake protein TrkH